MKNKIFILIAVLGVAGAVVYGAFQLAGGSYTAHAAAVSSARSGNWSDAATWSGGQVPRAGDTVTISSGHTVTYNASSNAVLGEVRINGTLKFSRTASTRLKTNDNILVQNGGFLDMGTFSDPIPDGVQAEIIWALPANASFGGGDSFRSQDKGLWVMDGGKWEAHGAPLVRTWSKLSQTASGNTLVVADNVSDWKVGGYLAINSTNVARNYFVRSSDNREFSNASNQAEVRRITAIQAGSGGGTTITLDRALSHTHEGTGTVRAAVGYLTRNVVFATEPVGANLSDLNPSEAERRYAHTMFMHGSTGNLHYAEFRRMGHRNTSARYPIHLHMLGSNFSSKIAAGSRMRLQGNSVWLSGHRGYVIHDTNGTLVEDNVLYDTFGHGYRVEKSGSPLGNPQGGRFCRDCPEGPHDNVFSHNLGILARSETSGTTQFSVFWLEHLDQVLFGNYASGGGSARGSRGADDNLSGGGFGVAELANGSGKMQVPLFIKNDSVSNFSNGMWTWNNNIPSNMAIVELSAIRNGTSGMRWGAYGADYRFYQSRFIENGRFGLNITSVNSHIQDSLVRGGSSSGSTIDKGYLISP